VGGTFPPTVLALTVRGDLSLLPPPAFRRAQGPSSRKREDSWELSLSALGKRSHTPSVVADATTSPPFGSASWGETT
jgi:hypothetical protein